MPLTSSCAVSLVPGVRDHVSEMGSPGGWLASALEETNMILTRPCEFSIQGLLENQAAPGPASSAHSYFLFHFSVVRSSQSDPFHELKLLFGLASHHSGEENLILFST